jgi:hypothetical protein
MHDYTGQQLRVGWIGHRRTATPVMFLNCNEFFVIPEEE